MIYIWQLKRLQLRQIYCYKPVAFLLLFRQQNTWWSTLSTTLVCTSWKCVLDQTCQVASCFFLFHLSSNRDGSICGDFLIDKVNPSEIYVNTSVEENQLRFSWSIKCAPSSVQFVIHLIVFGSLEIFQQYEHCILKIYIFFWNKDLINWFH